MPEWIFRIFLPIYFVGFGGAIVLYRLRIARRIGRDPVVIRRVRAEGGIGATIASLLPVSLPLYAVVIAANALAPSFVAGWLAVPALRTRLPSAQIAGWGGFALLCVGAAVAFAAIARLGASWRIGIDREGPGPLVTGGVYSLVRHPIYTGLLASNLGLAFVTGDVLAIGMAAGTCVSMPLQARLEEAFLVERFGGDYARYMARTGRFVPGIGRVRE